MTPDAFAEITRPDIWGRVIVRFEGRELSVRFSWQTIREMQAEWGDDWFETATRGMDNKRIAELSEMACFGSGLTPEELDALALPILSVAKACVSAWQWAWVGGEVPDDDVEPEKAKPHGMLFAQLWSRLCALVSRGATSGTKHHTRPAR